MKIVIDKNIPFVAGVFEPYAEILYKKGGDITAEDVRDADALMIRTRTRCDEKLLDGSNVKMIATATIGFDHIDIDYCARHGIEVSRAVGCNAYGVVQYVCAALLHEGVMPPAKIAVVGVGAVGGALSETLTSFGFEVMPVDPPRAEREGKEHFFTLEEALSRADVVTLHVPLERGGDYPTIGMADSTFFGMMKKDALFINSSRGEVVVQKALNETLKEKKIASAVIDVWNGEPAIDKDTLKMVSLGTPHIAGYSLQGKAAGSSMSVRALARYLGIDDLKEWWPEEVKSVSHEHKLSWHEVSLMMKNFYDIEKESETLKAHPEEFENLRNEYRYREEFF